MFKKIGDWFGRVTADNLKNNTGYMVGLLAFFSLGCLEKFFDVFHRLMMLSNHSLFQIIGITLGLLYLIVIILFVFGVINFIKQIKNKSYNKFYNYFDLYGYYVSMVALITYLVNSFFLNIRILLLVVLILFVTSITFYILGYNLEKSKNE